MAQLRLTKGERLLLKRRRIGWNQTEYARYHAVKFDTYSLWERDLRKDAPVVELGEITQSERYFILRRRSGKTLRWLACKVKCSITWYKKMEKCEVDDSRLKGFWDEYYKG